MAKFHFILKDRQTVYIEAKNLQEARAMAMRDYGIAYIIEN